ncbi:MAG: ABC transporter ATP-binding protein [Actinobacteria bacterium]|nr:ABC transporter ATP-binding protein [Actinomycetota bacterium]
MVELSGVHKTYKTGSITFEALRGVSLEVQENEYIAITGPSGSGKSTLMNILGCLDIPTAGTYLLGGEDVSTMSEKELAVVRNKRIGFVFQQFNLLRSMTAQRNVELPLMYAGVHAKERHTLAREALERVGLGDRTHHRPGELSGGQQQRACIARALVTNPDIILADEPTGNLDSVSTHEVLRLLHELHDQGRTIILITHEHDVALESQRQVQIYDGLLTEGLPV